MSFTNFSLLNSVIKLPADVTVDGEGNSHIYVSPDQTNGTGSDLSTGLRVLVDYEDFQGDAGSTRLQAIIEGKSDTGNYYPLHYQFEPMKVGLAPQSHQIVLQPDMFWLDAGIGNFVFVAGKSVAIISNQQGVLPETWRVCIRLDDPNTQFVSTTISVYGSRFNNA